MQIEGRALSALFEDPSLWKGPIVPFFFGLAYWIAPFPESVLVFNSIAFGLSASVLVFSFIRLSAGKWVSTLAVLSWIAYLPNRHVFGYYYAEPLLALIVATITLCVGEAILQRKSIWVLISGALCGILLLARAPFILAVMGIPFVLAFHLPEFRWRHALLFGIGLVATFTPWGVRNWIEFGEVIPFTTEGGKILFQGTYLPGDDCDMNTLRQMPSFLAIEAGERSLTPVEQYRYWRTLAFEQIRENPSGQTQLCLRKAIRFWIYLPQHTWQIAWKTAMVAAVCLPLAAIGGTCGWRMPVVQICCLWVGGLWAFHAIVHSELRYNFPVLPYAFLLATHGASRLMSVVRKRHLPNGTSPPSHSH
jgi:hypothetical protein